MQIQFEKWHGCQNDFIVIFMSENNAKYALNSLQKMAPILCDKTGQGIGSDGILVLIQATDPSKGRSDLMIINSDGSLAKNCGNGLRCAAASLKKFKQCKLHEPPKSEVELYVQNYGFISQYVDSNTSYTKQIISINMGIPLLNEHNKFHQKVHELVNTFAFEIVGLKDNIEKISSCKVSNDHIMIFLKQPANMIELIELIGPKLQHSDAWDGINVHIAFQTEWNSRDKEKYQKILGGSIGDSYKACSWERGVGPTKACGSGATAIAVATLDDPFSSRDAWVNINMPGGSLYIKQTDEHGEAILAGPAEFVYEGQFTL